MYKALPRTINNKVDISLLAMRQIPQYTLIGAYLTDDKNILLETWDNDWNEAWTYDSNIIITTNVITVANSLKWTNREYADAVVLSENTFYGFVLRRIHILLYVEDIIVESISMVIDVSLTERIVCLNPIWKEVRLGFSTTSNQRIWICHSFLYYV